MNFPFSSELSKNPFKTIEILRKEGPLIRQKIPILGKVWLTSNQNTAALILKDDKNFRVRKPDGQAVGIRWWMPKVIHLLASNMLSMDEPEHKGLRMLVEGAFRRDVILALEPRMEEIADQMVRNLFKDRDEVDIVNTFARHFPLVVICELLGLPKEDRPQFAKWAEGFTRVNNIVDFLLLVPKLRAMAKYLQTKIDEVREQGGEGLIAELASQEFEGAKLTNDEMLAMVFLLLIAGHETTTHLISGGVLALLQNPDQKEWLKSDWSRADLAVEELLRFVTPVQLTKPRYAYADTTIGDVEIKKGQLVMALLTASDFDKDIFDDPDQLKLDRKPNRHMAFGSGIHFCLGHQLARLEGKVAFKSLFTHYPNLKLAVTSEQIKRRKRIGLNALASLPVRAE